MRKTLWIAVLIIYFASSAKAQTTAVTATVTDSDSVTWNNFSFIITFQPIPGYSGQYTYQGATFVPQQYTGNANASGVMNVTIPDNSFIFPSGTKWQFVLQPFASGQSTQFTIPVTGASQNFTSLFSTGVKPPRFSASGTTWGYSDVEITPTPNPGGSYYSVTQNCVRVWNSATLVFACTGGGGGGGCTSGGNLGDLVKGNGSGGCLVAAINDNNSIINVNETENVNANQTINGTETVNGNLIPKGPNPTYDITNPSYGAQPDNVTGTATTNGTTTVTLAGAYAFTNGEGVAIQGAGPTPALSTPPAPTVVTGNLIGLAVPNPQLTTGVTASNTYTYWFVDRTLNGGLSVAGTQTSISNGLPLGMQTAAVTSFSQTGHTLTLTFGSTPNVGNGTHFDYSGASGNSQYGNSVKSQVTGTTSTTITAIVASYCATTCTGTGGTFTWENGNKISRSLQSSPVWQTYICGERPGDSSGHILGAMDPVLVNYTGSGYRDYEAGSANTTTVFTWTDYGATQSNPTAWAGFGTFPFYVTDSICANASVTPEMLYTTIVSGAGTTTLVLANAASQTASGLSIQSDAGAGIQAADNAAFNNSPNIRGSITIPDVSSIGIGRFVVHRPLLLKSFVNLVGSLNTAEPITIQGALVGVKNNASNPQFAWFGTSSINGNQGAYPVIIQDSDQNYIGTINLQVNATNASKVLLMARNQNETIEGVSFITGNSTNDYCGMSIEVPLAAFNFRLKDITSLNGPNQAGNSSWCPSIFFYNTGSGGTIAHLSVEGDSYVSPRGIYIDGTGWPLSTMNFDNYYSQGAIFPGLSVFNVATPQITFSKCSQLLDTSTQAIIDIEQVGGPTGTSNMYTCGLSNTSGSGALPFTGTGQGAPPIADFPNLQGGVLPASFLQPGTTGRTILGQTWFAYDTLVPQSSYPNAPLSGYFNYGLLIGDPLPSLKDSNGNKYFPGTWNTSSVTPNNNDCVKWVISAGVTSLGDTNTPCPAAGFANPMTTLGDMIIENATPAPARLAGPTGPNGVTQTLCNTPLGGAAQLEAWCLAGVPVNNNAETTCASYTLNVLDRATNIECSGGTTATITIPVHTTTGFANNYPVDATNFNSGTLTVTTTSPDTIDGGSAGGSQTVLSNWDAHLRQDASGNWHTIRVPTQQGFNSNTNCGDATHALNFSTTTGIGCQSLSSTALTIQTNGTNNTSQTTLNFVNPSNFNGLTFTFSNPSSGNETFALGGTLNNPGLTNSTIPINGTTCTLGTACTPLPNSAGSSDVTNQSTSQSAVTLATAPPAGHYVVDYYADLNSACPTGANTVNFTFNWTDVGGARSDTTGNLTMGTSQLSSSYMTGVFPIWADGVHNVTYTSTVNGSCASGTSSYDVHVTLERIR